MTDYYIVHHIGYYESVKNIYDTIEDAIKYAITEIADNYHTVLAVSKCSTGKWEDQQPVRIIAEQDYQLPCEHRYRNVEVVTVPDRY